MLYCHHLEEVHGQLHTTIEFGPGLYDSLPIRGILISSNDGISCSDLHLQFPEVEQLYIRQPLAMPRTMRGELGASKKY